jgi:hypothetical protein
LGNPLPFLLAFALFLINCGLDIEDPTPPSPPVWVQKSLPEEWPERGIDAHESGGIMLEWEGNPDEEIEVYEIYRAEYYKEVDSLGVYNQIARFELVSINVLKFVDTQIRERHSYFYKILAQDAANNYSQFSDSIGYSLLSGIHSELMIPNGVTDSLNSQNSLSWYYDYHIEMENYCITILSENNELILRSVFAPTAYIVQREYWQIPDSINLIPGQNYKWRIDTNANYMGLIETSGSESPWASLVYTGH